MPSYKTLAQILITTSVASFALTAPIILPEFEEAKVIKSEASSTAADDGSSHHSVDTQSKPLPALPTTPNPPTAKPPQSENSKLWHTAPIMGLIGGSLASVGGLIQKGINSAAPHYNYQNSTFQRSFEETDHISRGLAELSDEHLLFLRDISRRALESLD